ncbi:hypothetical protein BABINDRAFT_159110 [Babjeviella inositovora NRRL Y-12698]|uniref:Ceramide very long chain fatty acid hydroxylase n=1 Tax=Babjeviella inositovora NRRL Y-12698 TaxID=984486 RepID=A0A1E3QY74_9ASCO|nr:uncharacterized protein BABINDRAFT_159110 [Babjeviella inositovora NRRL Y-12698]ODQ82544.1 hypothetical protein BABINDRAFT_159110 [Babjeviella inositovora NRRL Y-12698]
MATKTYPLFSSSELASHNTATDCWVSLNNRKIYNVADFLEDHPGGADLILEYAGKDITAIMADEISHEHSESAYEILDDAYMVGYLATDEEEKNLLHNKNNVPVEVTLDLTQFQEELPAEELLNVKTDYDSDLKKHKFLDLNKPLFFQMLFCDFSKDFYLDQVHRPRHYGKGDAVFFGNYLEPFSKTAWWVVPMLWLPVDGYFFYQGWIHNSHPLLHLFWWGVGLFVWTLLEYGLHRFLFHLDHYLPDHPLALTIHFTMHGVHHYLPMDGYRLVMPPAMLIALATPIYKLVFMLLPYRFACSGFAGGFLGYIMYDVIHYLLHHSKLPGYLQRVKKYHLEHHYKNYELGFGVTSNFWDNVFDTNITSVYHKKTQ